MITLKQIRQKKREKLHKIFIRRPVFVSLNEKDENECLRLWLQQKQKELPKYTHRDVTLFIVNLIKDLNSDNND